MTDLPATNALELTLEDGWLQVVLDRPRNRNALSAELAGELVKVFEEIRDDRGVRGVSLRGRGGVFCAGADLKAFAAIEAAGDAAQSMAKDMSHAGARLFRLIDAAPQVTVALIEGAAMAGGFGLACACDLAAATGNTRFALTETRIGLTPAQIAPYVLRRLGTSAGRRLMLLGSVFDGAEAERIGLVDRLVSDGSGLDAFEQEVRAQVLACAPGAIAATKEVIAASARLAPEDLAELAAERFAAGLVGAEGREGVASFIERRPPSWANSRQRETGESNGE
jgi:isohexenylglutaconyl-CoA hydratase